MRAVAVWIGKNDDTPAPHRVRLRIFEAYEGRCQCGCGRKILAGEQWDLDHYVALANGGANSELNMRPLLREHHKEKSLVDLAAKSKTYKTKSRHLGIRPKSKFACSRDSKWKKKISGEVVRR